MYEQTEKCKAKRLAYRQSEVGRISDKTTSARYRASFINYSEHLNDTDRMENYKMNNIDGSALTVSQVAKELNASTGTVHILLKENRLKGFRLNRQWRINRADLDEFRNMPGDPE